MAAFQSIPSFSRSAANSNISVAETTHLQIPQIPSFDPWNASNSSNSDDNEQAETVSNHDECHSVASSMAMAGFVDIAYEAEDDDDSTVAKSPPITPSPLHDPQKERLLDTSFDAVTVSEHDAPPNFGVDIFSNTGNDHHFSYKVHGNHDTNTNSNSSRNLQTAVAATVHTDKEKHMEMEPVSMSAMQKEIQMQREQEKHKKPAQEQHHTEIPVACLVDLGVSLQRAKCKQTRMHSDAAQVAHPQAIAKENKPKNSKHCVTLDVKKHFDGDALAHSMWYECCCRVEQQQLARFDLLFPELISKIWHRRTKCRRIPCQPDIKAVFLRLGGFAIDNEMYVMERVTFIKFYKWFTKCCIMVDELSFLWDAFKSNLFCSRKDAESVLMKSPPGTFLLRVSATMLSSMVISYTDANTSSIKHCVLKHHSPSHFIVQKRKNAKKTNLHHLIRSFVKLKYIYCGVDKIYPKHVVF
mmetsp:Transcript_56514/g.90019  ORF Transcript_56514/g.90019 Transcript_56514/m.90019 type:complete len:468 (-) Transcript_56514:147-1550(-)|eukprot:CAMPEP_0197056768 /NCGR_PEP_ID=MMETSP1384-20130603/89164_1 /TAXON_ID=29189 /ORGANISM="Ammonia sp." /LENGTH=467 /DNA_ID=CAMNT_0042490911 /DNA_START=37 /DNA_END=1440 /DNA_ORIENTATION=+